MKETVERNGRFYTNEKGEIKTENEQLKEWLIIANKENERLNNIIKNMEEELLMLYLDFVEFNVEKAKKEINKLKGVIKSE